ncbi:MAG: hypothetical protein V3T88_07565 [Nitrosomonadaceae bacterium]
MPNIWFRLYNEFAYDPKVQMLSESDQRRLVMLMCIRSSNADETFQDVTLAFQLRVSLDEWLSTKKTFIDAGFINDANELINWDKRQYVSDSSTARVRKHRESRKQPVKRRCNVSVTPPDTDTDTDTDTDNPLVVSLEVKPKPKKEKTNAKKGTRLPEGWAPSEPLAKSIADRENLTAEQIANEAYKFCNYWLAASGTKACKLDWDRTFRNWCSNANGFGTTGVSGAARRGGGSQGAVQLAEAAEKAARKRQDMGEEAFDPFA